MEEKRKKNIFIWQLDYKQIKYSLGLLGRAEPVYEAGDADGGGGWIDGQIEQSKSDWYNYANTLKDVVVCCHS